MVKSTKVCSLEVHMLSGTRIAGKFCVEASTSSTIRPSDAIRDSTGEYLLLVEATVHSGGEPYARSALLVRKSGIAHIELSEGWVHRT